MKHGHCTGTKRHRPSESAWYASIQAAALAEIDRQWAIDHPAQPQEVTQKPYATARSHYASNIVHALSNPHTARTVIMAYRPEPNDPFAGSEKTPALSWKELPVGSVFTLEVLEPAKILHSRNFQTGELDYWDSAKQQPRLSAVVNVLVKAGPHSVGEKRSVWAQRPSNLYAAIAEAQKVAQARMTTGGILHLQFSGEIPHDNPRFSAIKQYRAKYDPPADAFSRSVSSPAANTWGQPGATTPPSSQPGGWPGAAQPAPAYQAPPPAPAQPILPGSAPKGAGAGIPF